MARWPEVERLYHAARSRPPDERAAFLERECRGDKELRAEVESLLAASEAPLRTGGAAAAVAYASPCIQASFTGRLIGVYEIEGLLGAGGMGEVYRARDTRLRRDVAIKILPKAFSDDPDRLARFEREAQLLAALNHPNIATIHGIEDFRRTPDAGSGPPDGRAIVMELITGETLAQRIARGRFALSDALAVARQICQALDAAHERGIIHRDLKPANITITPDGLAKVLDFGLAKALSPNDVHDASATTLDGTREGLIVGTAAYMSPEQARGQHVDKRTDIWAFGCVLFEMLTGRPAFAQETLSDTIAAVLEREPDWSTLPPTTPPGVRRLIERCLEKDQRQRLRDIGDAFADQERAVTPRADRRRWSPIALGTASVAALAAGILVGVSLSRPGREGNEPDSGRKITRLSVPLGAAAGGRGRRGTAISPDGKTLVYAAAEQLYVRPLDQLEARPLAGTEPLSIATTSRARVYQAYATMPFFSPEGQWVGFLQNGQLKKVPVGGGAAVPLCDVGNPHGASWAGNGQILFAEGPYDSGAPGVWQCSSDGGTASRVIPVEPTEIPLDPHLLPDGIHVVFTVSPLERWDQAQVVVQPLNGGTRNVLVHDAVNALVLPDGYLLFGRRGTLFAARFDARTRQVEAGGVPVVTQVGQSTSAGGWPGLEFSVARDGTLVYLPASAMAPRRIPIWVDRQGNIEEFAGERRAYQYPRISPDGARVAFDMRDRELDIWLWELSRSTFTQLTTARHVGGEPVWSPDGAIVFAAEREGRVNLFRQTTSGTGTEERLSTHPQSQAPMALTKNGRLLIFGQVDPETKVDLYLLEMDTHEVRPLLRSGASETAAVLSPDDRWIAYQSDESGGRDEVYVRPFPDVNAKRVPISKDGGTRPLWSRDGKELFFLDRDRRLMAVPVRTDPDFSAGIATKLFDTRQFGLEGAGRNFDVSSDGKRFLFVNNLPTDVIMLTVVSNWIEELKQRMHTH